MTVLQGPDKIGYKLDYFPISKFNKRSFSTIVHRKRLHFRVTKIGRDLNVLDTGIKGLKIERKHLGSVKNGEKNRK